MMYVTYFLCSFFYLCCFAAGIYEGESLQGDIEDYLRTITAQQPVYQAPGLSTVRVLPPYPSVRLAQFTSSDSDFPESRSFSEGDKVSPHQWLGLRMPKQENTAFAASSYHMKKPKSSETVHINTKAIAFSSLRDVQNEELLNDGSQGFSDKDLEKKSPEPVERSYGISEAMARKSSVLTTVNHDSKVVTANENFSDVYFVAIVAGCCAAGIFGVISAGFCFYRLQKNSKAAAEVDYPAYGVTGPSKDTTSPNGDRKLAQSAQMYHYQHQKQQMIAVEKAGSTKNTSASDVDTEEENDEGDYTVYECPGLAPTGEMEVKNPLFNDDSTPMSPPVSSTKPDEIQAK